MLSRLASFEVPIRFRRKFIVPATLLASAVKIEMPPSTDLYGNFRFLDISQTLLYECYFQFRIAYEDDPNLDCRYGFLRHAAENGNQLIIHQPVILTQ